MFVSLRGNSEHVFFPPLAITFTKDTGSVIDRNAANIKCKAEHMAWSFPFSSPLCLCHLESHPPFEVQLKDFVVEKA
jgi:hypothetical protein